MSQQESSEKLSLFADRLRSRMARLGVQANELAEKLQVSPSAVSNWLSGVNSAKGRNLRRLAEELHVDPHWFYGETGNERDDTMVLKETGPAYGSTAEHWKRRALVAEQQLANLRNGLRSLLELSSPGEAPNPKPISSAPASEVEELLNTAESVVDSGSRSSLPKSGVAAPSEKKVAPSRDVSGESKVPPAPAAPAPKSRKP